MQQRVPDPSLSHEDEKTLYHWVNCLEASLSVRYIFTELCEHKK